MATGSSIPSWRIPWIEEPGGHKESDITEQAILHLSICNSHPSKDEVVFHYSHFLKNIY